MRRSSPKRPWQEDAGARNAEFEYGSPAFIAAGVAFAFHGLLGLYWSLAFFVGLKPITLIQMGPYARSNKTLAIVVASGAILAALWLVLGALIVRQSRRGIAFSLVFSATYLALVAASVVGASGCPRPVKWLWEIGCVFFEHDSPKSLLVYLGALGAMPMLGCLLLLVGTIQGRVRGEGVSA